ncbi:G-type lectin S-receptor-like serine/threonine-protein kinase LECRK4 [Durio zibethinus]|uniref:Receptor-like serine/threonine-protein kinase n=1 Tax=Durio zibethinus TaxID=66656 RepID=A0A6P5Y6D2_DURZI|nr:G-type lectin S-receptor-like serine/threonine-protein kinase LECRK4 [Durio zibethinus]
MISTLFLSYPFLFILVSIHGILATVHAQRSISVGDFLSANDKNMNWQSPSGDFAFGFHPIAGKKNLFILAIWYAKIPERTIVWYANRENPATDRDSKVELTRTGHLVLKDAKDKELWRSESITNDSQVSHAAMLDTGNFVIASNNSSNIWESFKYPTDTILPTQELDADGSLLSALHETSYNKGKYQLRFDEGSLILNQIDMFTRKPYNDYFSFGTGSHSRLIFNKSGYIQIQNSNGSLLNLAPENAVPKPESNYYRATLNFYGVFTLYSYPRNPSGRESWSVLWFRPRDICRSFVDITATLGNGPCGYNSFCEAINGRPSCTCPPGFSFLDVNNPYTGCKQDYTSYPGDCKPDGSTIREDRFEFKSMSFADFPFSDYGILQPATELECRQSCLLDCSCAVAILQDPTLSADGSGTCWKKKLPLSNGWFDRDALDRTALFKVPKSNASRTNQAAPNPSNENQNQVILILSVILGTSAIFNFFFLVAVSLIFFCLYQRRLRYLDGFSSRRDLETNLRSFTYKDLEQATNRFKEELGRGAFGTVYKGELPSSYGNYVAVKKLERFAKEGENEFKTEVKVIGQTHHKNLVRLLGYCDEGENRLLVYDFMQNGTLASFLFGVLRPSWQRRLQIASGIAKGLTYLHEECNTQIIHCDIKPQNILLDDSFTAKISDFGLSKLLINNNTRTLTGIRGTKGYVAPEWFRNTPVTVKVDVYSFGVVLLEIICCRRCVEVEMEEATILTEWAYECYSEGIVAKLVENDEEARSDVVKAEMLLKVAIWCVQENPFLRPSMRTVTMMLDGAVQVPTPPCPFLVDSMI